MENISHPISNRNYQFTIYGNGKTPVIQFLKKKTMISKSHKKKNMDMKRVPVSKKNIQIRKTYTKIYTFHPTLKNVY